MAQYTLELRTILKSKDIFKSINYDLYDNNLKPIFEDKFIKRFYFREIGVETINRFIINLETELNEIMPYYKDLYSTTLIKYDVLNNIEIQEDIINELIKENTSRTTTSNNTESRAYDTPITARDVYRKSPSFINEGVDRIEGTNNTNSKNNERFTKSIRSNQTSISKQDLIKKQRELIINIDKMILDDLEVLFMQVF